jgi:magnesium transporter
LLELYRADGDASRIGSQLPPKVIWIDLLNPTDDEKSSVERVLDIRIPTEAALNEIEASSRLISRNGLLYLSSPAVRVDDQGEAHLTPVGFVIGPHVLVTIRFAASQGLDRLAVNRFGGSAVDELAPIGEARSTRQWCVSPGAQCRTIAL